MQFHARFVHLLYDTIERMARDARSSIFLTDRVRAKYLTYAAQPQKDSGRNAPIDRIGSVLCSGMKGPVTQNIRMGSRYLRNLSTIE